MLKEVSSRFQENFKKASEGLSRMCHRNFDLQFCRCMALIAATLAVGGFVKICQSKKKRNALCWLFCYLPLSFYKKKNTIGAASCIFQEKKEW